MKILFLVSNVSFSKTTLCRWQNVACELRVERPCFRAIRSQNRAHSIPKKFVSTPEDGSKDGLRHVVVQLKTTTDTMQIRLRNAPNHLQEPAEFNSLHFYLRTVSSSVVSQTNVHSINVNKNPTRCNSMQIFIYCKVTLHVSGVTAPIIRSTKNCNRRLRYRS